MPKVSLLEQEEEETQQNCLT